MKQTQDPIKAIKTLQSENIVLKKELASLNKLKSKVLKNKLIEELKIISEINFIAKELDLDAQGMKDLSFEMGDQLDKAILIFGSRKTGKPLLSCYISKSLVSGQGKDAGKVIRELGKYIQGGGGGQAFFSTAGGKNLNGIKEALKAAEAICFK